MEFDIFVESMAYRQARDYVRLISVRYLVATASWRIRSPTLGGLLPERGMEQDGLRDVLMRAPSVRR